MRAHRTIESSLLRLKWLAAAANFELAMRRHALALKYSPDQPRDDHGRWTSEGAVTSSHTAKPKTKPSNSPINDPRVISDATPDDNWKPDAQYAANEEGAEKKPRSRGTGIIMCHEVFIVTSLSKMKRARFSMMQKQAVCLLSHMAGAKNIGFTTTQLVNVLTNYSARPNLRNLPRRKPALLSIVLGVHPIREFAVSI
jgi:hypothetical protein